MAIPKVISFFWAKGKMSWMRYLTLHSFRHYHPDWKIFLYQLDNPKTTHNWPSAVVQDIEIYNGPDYFNLISDLDIECITWDSPIDNISPAQASDICQWEILSEHGGYYADMDILFTGKVPHNDYSHVDNLFCLWGGYMAIGFCGAQKQTQLMIDLANLSKEFYQSSSYQSCGVIAVYGLASMASRFGVAQHWLRRQNPGMTAINKLQQRYGKERIGCLPTRSVYPWTVNELHRIYHQTHYVPKECFGIHWFGGAPMSQDFNLKIDDDTLCLYDCTFKNYALLCLNGFYK